MVPLNVGYFWRGTPWIGRLPSFRFSKGVYGDALDHEWGAYLRHDVGVDDGRELGLWL